MNGKISLADLPYIAQETEVVNNLVKSAVKVQHMIDSTGTGQDKRDFFASAEFVALLDHCNGDDLIGMLNHFLPSIKRRIKDRASQMERVYGMKIDIPT